jgi:hypothetical protein
MKKIVLFVQKLQAYDGITMDNSKQQQETCALCGLAVEIEGFSLMPEGLQKFCCAGCLSIYQLLNDEHIGHDDIIEPPLTTQP